MDKFAGNFGLLDVCGIAALTAKVAALSEDDGVGAGWCQERFDTHRAGAAAGAKN